MRVIYTSKGMSKKVWGARYLSKNTIIQFRADSTMRNGWVFLIIYIYIYIYIYSKSGRRVLEWRKILSINVSVKRGCLFCRTNSCTSQLNNMHGATMKWNRSSNLHTKVYSGVCSTSTDKHAVLPPFSINARSYKDTTQKSTHETSQRLRTLHDDEPGDLNR
jgi:hypothetical protein